MDEASLAHGGKNVALLSACHTQDSPFRAAFSGKAALTKISGDAMG
jgi:hypothetical protein